MSSQICLKWNSFLSNIATSFESLWEEEGLVDVTLASDGQCLTAHKVILSASSPFFKKVFQTNPCQHPVIILQDVRFSELEALLIFIYKGEVNIEQKNLPALLKAAETLQIRGLSGGDIFAKESYKRLAELEQEVAEDAQTTKEETPKKKQKVYRQQQCNSVLDIASEPRISRTESTEDSVSEDQGGKEVERETQNSLSDLSYSCPETKIEPTEMSLEDHRRRSPIEKDPGERLDTGQIDGSRGPSKPIVRVIAEAREASALSTSSREPSCPRQRSPDRPWDECRDQARDRLGERSPEYLEDHSEGQEEEQPEDQAQARSTFSIALEVRPAWKGIAKSAQSSTNSASDAHPDTPEVTESIETSLDREECPPSPLLSERNPRVLRPPFPACTGTPGNSDFLEEGTKGAVSAYPPFPCPFCDRAYTSWGFRRRHIKAVHTITPSLNCKWCLQVLPSHAAWRRHVISAHNLSASDAHNGLLILEEAHMVLQIARPTRLDTLVNIIKQSSQQNSGQDNSQVDKE